MNLREFVLQELKIDDFWNKEETITVWYNNQEWKVNFTIQKIKKGV